jgi:hypothetical protein
MIEMANLDQIINHTKNYQDVELASAIGELKKNPAQMQRFLQNQQSRVFNDIVKQKDNTFQKVYGDLNRSTQVQESVSMYGKRSKELADIHQQLYDNQQNNATAVMDDKNLANRKYEMNEWSIGDKNDTLFVMSSLFIMLSGLLLLVGLWRVGIISSFWCALFGGPLILSFIFIVVNRSEYTDNLRNKRYWNKKTFEGKYGKIPLPNCPSLVQGIQNAEANIQRAARSNMTNLAKGLANASSATAQELNMFSNTINTQLQGNTASPAAAVAAPAAAAIAP